MIGPEHLTASEAIAQLTAGTLSAEALTRACLEQAHAGAEIKAWAWLDPGRRSRRLVRRPRRSQRPAGRRSGRGQGHHRHGRHADRARLTDLPRKPAVCRCCLRRADPGCRGVILGKTVTTEFANRHPGPTVHPHNAEHTPGGSSSGSAAAVADFQVPLALGTQTGGSVIRPAAFCGVIGYKPSFGEFSRVGVKMQCHNLDTLGIICRSLEDVALLRGVLLAQEPHRVDRRSAAPRIGFCRTPAWEHADRDTHALLQRTAEVLAAAGAKVREITLTPADILDHHRRVFEFEAARNYAYEYEVHGEKFSPALREGLLAPGRALPLAAYIEAIETAEAFRRNLDDTFAEVDVLLAPSAPGEAPKGLGSTGDARFNAIWTLAWTPCLTLPAGNGRSGLPLGIQLVGQRFRDEALLDAAAWVESRLH